MEAFGDELGILFQAVDDILDGDGLVTRVGVDGARRVADDAADQARQWLGALAAETTVLRELVEASRCGRSSAAREAAAGSGGPPEMQWVRVAHGVPSARMR